MRSPRSPAHGRGAVSGARQYNQSGSLHLTIPLIALRLIGVPAFFMAVPVCLLAEDFSVELRARSQAQQQAVKSADNPKTRPVLSARTGENLRLQWTAANAEKGPALYDVTMHVFLEKENAIAQSDPPKPGAQAPYESALIMDFEPGAKSSGDLLVQAPGPGVYLLRVETIGASKKLGHECFAAMDVRVQ